MMAQVVIAGGITNVDAGDPAAQRAWAEMRTDLRSIPGLRVEERAVKTDGEPKKGWETELIVGLTGTGTITGLVQVFKLWLGRDRRRHLRLTVSPTPGGGKVVEVDADNASTELVRNALEVAFRIDGQAGIGPQTNKEAVAVADTERDLGDEGNDDDDNESTASNARLGTANRAQQV
jgi:Effector Associated Constant Component 1